MDEPDEDEVEPEDDDDDDDEPEDEDEDVDPEVVPLVELLEAEPLSFDPDPLVVAPSPEESLAAAGDVPDLLSVR